MNKQLLTISQLDKQLSELKTVSQRYGKPRAGWIKTIRVALRMSAEQFADRLGLTRGRVNQLESAEAENAVTLRSLKEAADALGCELVYAIVPKGNSTLKDIIKRRAEQIACEQIERVAHSMSLESQSVDIDDLKMQQDEIVRSLMAHVNRKFWDNSDNINQLAKIIWSGMQKKNLIKSNSKSDPEFIETLKNYISELENKKNLKYHINDPNWINALSKAIFRYQKSINPHEPKLEHLKRILKEKK